MAKTLQFDNGEPSDDRVRCPECRTFLDEKRCPDCGGTP